MARKRIALTDYITTDGVAWTNGEFRSIGIVNEDEEVDASGFNATGASETLQGIRTQTIEAEIYVGTEAGGTQDILYPLYRDRSTFAFSWRRDPGSVSTTNPEWTGNAKLYGWSEGATRGEVEVTTVTFKAADSTGFVLEYS